jgi:hypothetical protein
MLSDTCASAWGSRLLPDRFTTNPRPLNLDKGYRALSFGNTYMLKLLVYVYICIYKTCIELNMDERKHVLIEIFGICDLKW